MSSEHLDHAARNVLQRYSQVAPAAMLHRLASHGGFSGACLWQVPGGSNTAVLKARPPTEVDVSRLLWIHQLMRGARQAGLEFVPAVHADDEGHTAVKYAD